MIAVTPVRPDLQRRVTAELVKDSETLLTNVFLTVLVTGMSSGHSQGG